jgi:hypothetical protein
MNHYIGKRLLQHPFISVHSSQSRPSNFNNMSHAQYHPTVWICVRAIPANINQKIKQNHSNAVTNLFHCPASTSLPNSKWGTLSYHVQVNFCPSGQAEKPNKDHA